MNFIFLDSLYADININLRALSRGTERYQTLLYQHEGILDLTNGGQKLGNQRDETAKFRSFLTLAKETGTDIALTPEYSCPWQNIHEILDDETRWPDEGKLWALGAESITPAQLATFRESYTKDNIVLQFEDRNINGRIFLDPLVYIFKANFGNSLKLMVVIQFKTHHMGVWTGGDLERDRLIEGQNVYILRNDQESVNLLTVICSEAMNFPAEMNEANRRNTGWNDRPFLILNPQINPDPQYPEFINFRNFIFNQDRKEIIDLNWNLKSKIQTHDLLRSGTSRSGIFMSSHDVNFGNIQRIRQNHKRGMYYFYFGKHRHAFFLNSLPHAFLIDNLSVHINEGVQAQRMRNGPELSNTYVFNAAEILEPVEAVSDDHLKCLADLQCENTFLLDPNHCVFEKERLVCISSGEFVSKTETTWSGIDYLFSIRIAEGTEINKRMTVTEDRAVDSVNQRSRYITAVNTLDLEILPDKNNYPQSIADLKLFPVFLAYGQHTDVNREKYIKREKYRYNLTDQGGEIIRATVCYLGVADEETVGKTYDFLQSMFEDNSMERRRVVVFYKSGREFAVKADGQAGKIVVPEDFGSASYLSEQ